MDQGFIRARAKAHIMRRIQEQRVNVVHEPIVYTRMRDALPYRGGCSCGWRGHRQAQWHEADTDAREHAELMEGV